MTERVELDCEFLDIFPLGLKPGQAWALYSDEGPHEMCGQSMRTTCPHSVLWVFDSEEEVRTHFTAANHRNGKNPRLMWGVVKEYTAGGVFAIVDKRTPDDGV